MFLSDALKDVLHEIPHAQPQLSAQWVPSLHAAPEGCVALAQDDLRLLLRHGPRGM